MCEEFQKENAQLIKIKQNTADARFCGIPLIWTLLNAEIQLNFNLTINHTKINFISTKLTFNSTTNQTQMKGNTNSLQEGYQQFFFYLCKSISDVRKHYWSWTMLRIMHSISLVPRGRAVVSYEARKERSPRQEVCLLERLFVSFTSIERRAHISPLAVLISPLLERRLTGLGCPIENTNKSNHFLLSFFLHPSYFFIYVRVQFWGRNWNKYEFFTRQKFLR